MNFFSTRGKTAFSFSEAVLRGIAPDGGLFSPDKIPKIGSDFWEKFSESNFAEVAAEIFSKFANDFSLAEIRFAADSAFSLRNFSNSKIAPVRQISSGFFLLELFHGPTGAFKDFALQFLPRIFSLAIEKESAKPRCVLVATSGDTGGAALSGFSDLPNVCLFVFFPKNGVSELQKLQMKCSPGKNVAAIEINGDFDIAQTGVKEIFINSEFLEKVKKFGIKFSSANSINIGRLLPQIFYYFFAFLQLRNSGKILPGEKIDIAIPVGNFGNVLAAFFAKKMGLPVKNFIVASNENDSITKFLQTGTFDLRNCKTKKTLSPAMDILRPSNLERLLFFFSENNSEKNIFWQKSLLENKFFTIEKEIFKKISDEFFGFSVSDLEISREIKKSWDEFDFLPDPHTAVAINASRKYRANFPDNKRKILIASTAHFGKFGKSVFQAVFPEKEVPNSEVEILKKLDKITQSPKIPENFFNIFAEKIRHQQFCDGSTNAMKKIILENLTSIRL